MKNLTGNIIECIKKYDELEKNGRKEELFDIRNRIA